MGQPFEPTTSRDSPTFGRATDTPLATAAPTHTRYAPPPLRTRLRLVWAWLTGRDVRLD